MIIITDHPQTTHEEAWLSYACYMWGKLTQYCGYHLCRLVQGVQRGLHGRFCLVLSCSNSTWTSASSSAPVVVARYNCLWKLSFALSACAYALCLPSYRVAYEDTLSAFLVSVLYWLGSFAFAVYGPLPCVPCNIVSGRFYSSRFAAKPSYLRLSRLYETHDSAWSEHAYHQYVHNNVVSCAHVPAPNEPNDMPYAVHCPHPYASHNNAFSARLYALYGDLDTPFDLNVSVLYELHSVVCFAHLVALYEFHCIAFSAHVSLLYRFLDSVWNEHAPVQYESHGKIWRGLYNMSCTLQIDRSLQTYSHKKTQWLQETIAYNQDWSIASEGYLGVYCSYGTSPSSHVSSFPRSMSVLAGVSLCLKYTINQHVKQLYVLFR
jgi:hypothetical protein